MESNEWYKYKEADVKKVINININLNSVPYLLIYRQKPIKYYNHYN